ncbi:MAG: carboxypeptidase regulatory-like domain-containing protein [Acidobacteria bacterium]|nr:carboxypeptidase regulatory-like domain-containing protein [Acidobacteriota bacterium]
MTPIPHRIVACAGAVCLLAGALTVVRAQQLGHLTGTVKDMGGQAIKGASIRARNPGAIPNEFNVSSDAKGHWGVLGLQTGRWEVTASAPGFETSTVALRVSALGANPSVQFVLIGTPPRGALEDVDTKALQADLSAAESLMAGEQWDEAIVAYRAILAKAPPLTMINLALGRALRMKKDYAGAAAAYRELLKADAGNQKALLELGLTERERGDRAAAVAVLEKLIAIDGTTAEAGQARAALDGMKK